MSSQSAVDEACGTAKSFFSMMEQVELPLCIPRIAAPE
jgi:hypothetical protein